VRDPEKYAEPRVAAYRPVKYSVWGVSVAEAGEGPFFPAVDRAESRQEAFQSLKAYAQMQLKRGRKQILTGVEFSEINGRIGWFAVWA